ncbi:hypothetical protein ACFV46_10330 [Streptomyces sp. NPDC059852]|uniref:hypothetical protein n=1 Tax=Streptomyces sp. NPDC059852 TaxID=3346972 RepID=UPI0036484BBE
MPVTVVRFDLVEPEATPASPSARYRAALEPPPPAAGRRLLDGERVLPALGD